MVLTAGLALLLLAGLAGADAPAPPAVDTGPVIQNSRTTAAVDRMPAMSVRQQLQDELTKAGLSDIAVTSSSFCVHAKNKQGDPVAMVTGPDSFTEATEMPMKGAEAPGGAIAGQQAPGTAAPKQ